MTKNPSRELRPTAPQKEILSTEEFDQVLRAAETEEPMYVLRLYVAGLTPKSTRTIADV